MVTKIKIIACCTSLFYISLNISCGKLVCSDSVKYAFDIQAEMHPDKDSIQIGDTMWLEVNAPTTFVDNISNQPVDFSGAENLGTSISMRNFYDENASISDVDKSFDYISIIGSTTPPSGQYSRSCLFKEINNTYQFKMGIVPKEKGLFGMILGSPAGIYRKAINAQKHLLRLHLKILINIFI